MHEHLANDIREKGCSAPKMMKIIRCDVKNVNVQGHVLISALPV